MFSTYTEFNCKVKLKWWKFWRNAMRLCPFFHHSTQAAQKLGDVQQQLKEAEHTLTQSVVSNWNSVFLHAGESLRAK